MSDGVFETGRDALTHRADTRRAVLARAAAESWIVAGADLPGFGRVMPEGSGFRIVPV